MNIIRELPNFEWWSVFLAIVVGITCFKYLFELFEWGINKFGIETNKTKEKKANDILLKETSNLAKEASKLAKETAELAKNTDTLAKDITSFYSWKNEIEKLELK